MKFFAAFTKEICPSRAVPRIKGLGHHLWILGELGAAIPEGSQLPQSGDLGRHYWTIGKPWFRGLHRKGKLLPDIDHGIEEGGVVLLQKERGRGLLAIQRAHGLYRHSLSSLALLQPNLLLREWVDRFYGFWWYLRFKATSGHWLEWKPLPQAEEVEGQSPRRWDLIHWLLQRHYHAASTCSGAYGTPPQVDC